METSDAGDLTLNATDSTSATAILLDGAEIQPISGTISLNGQSEWATAQYGIRLQGGTKIRSMISSPALSSTMIEAKDGDIIISGSSNGGGIPGLGVIFYNDVQLMTTGTGNIEVRDGPDFSGGGIRFARSSGPQHWMETSHPDADIILKTRRSTRRLQSNRDR
jgi:hypothetical protein